MGGRCVGEGVGGRGVLEQGSKLVRAFSGDFFSRLLDSPIIFFERTFFGR